MLEHLMTLNFITLSIKFKERLIWPCTDTPISSNLNLTQNGSTMEFQRLCAHSARLRPLRLDFFFSCCFRSTSFMLLNLSSKKWQTQDKDQLSTPLCQKVTWSIDHAFKTDVTHKIGIHHCMKVEPKPQTSNLTKTTLLKAPWSQSTEFQSDYRFQPINFRRAWFLRLWN